jgi:hypothetical protein
VGKDLIALKLPGVKSRNKQMTTDIQTPDVPSKVKVVNIDSRVHQIPETHKLDEDPQI